MTPESTSTSKLCPTCGTRVSENATRCLVCGSELSSTAVSRSAKPVQGTRMPEITLSLPAALGVLALLIIVGALLVYFVTRKTNTPMALAVTPTYTATLSPTVTLTSTDLPTATVVPTFTPLPTLSYTVKANDYCSTIAAIFKISINSIILLNNLDANCDLSPGMVLAIPQPTPTASPQPTATLSVAGATDAACQKVTYTVLANDTLSKIAAAYNVTIASIRDYNGLVGDTVQEGQPLTIPLCHQQPTAGPTPTATPPPPYAAPNLLLPADGAPFTLANDTITLQWASVGTLRSNEIYEVVIEDVTDSSGKKLVDYVTDTKYIVPTSFRPTDNLPHIMRWWVLTVRQTDTDSSGKPVYATAGAASTPRVFSWSGAATGPTPTSTP
jgi:LysM repeat protein